MNKQIIALYLLAVASFAGAVSFETQDLFTIDLPDGWVRVPDEALVSYAEAVDEASADVVAPVYDYGFQLDSGEGWLTFPCILVQVNYDGRFSTGDLERFAARSDGETAGLNEDQSLYIDVRERDGIKVIVARQLTEYGFIELSGFTTEDTFGQYQKVFLDAFSNLELDKVIRYQPRITDNAPVVGDINIGKVVVVFVQATLVGGVLWLFYGLCRRTIRRTPKNA